LRRPDLLRGAGLSRGAGLAASSLRGFGVSRGVVSCASDVGATDSRGFASGFLPRLRLRRAGFPDAPVS